ncbi:hypothetical protein Bca4012_008533 [Brassica carinata]
MLLLVGTPPRLTRSISRRGEELLKAQRSSLSPVSAFPTPSSLPLVRTRLSNVSAPAFVSVRKSPPSLPSKPEPPDLVPAEPSDLPLEALPPSDPPLEALPPSDPPLEALSPPEPPDPPDSPVASLVYGGDTSFVSKCWFWFVYVSRLSFCAPLYCRMQSFYCFVQFYLCGSLMLKIRDTSNTEILIKGFIAMLKIVDCALAAASISGVISLIVVANFQGFISLYSSIIAEIRGLLNVISCLSVLYGVDVWRGWLVNTLSMNGE